jgi:hypothetical protein
MTHKKAIFKMSKIRESIGPGELEWVAFRVPSCGLKAEKHVTRNPQHVTRNTQPKNESITPLLQCLKIH